MKMTYSDNGLFAISVPLRQLAGAAAASCPGRAAPFSVNWQLILYYQYITI